MKSKKTKHSEGVIYAWIELLIKKNYGREEFLLLNTANKTVEACAEWVSALYSHLALNPL